MITQWTSNLPTEEEKTRFKQTVLASRPVLERLKEMLETEEKGLSLAEMSPKIYDTPNWDYKQAHGNGYRAALNTVYKIINLDQEYNESVRPGQPISN